MKQLIFVVDAVVENF